MKRRAFLAGIGAVVGTAAGRWANLKGENLMITIRKSEERGHANHSWLDSHHTFSFANYYDPNFMGFRALRVINEDRVSGGAGFPTHPHREMEIISYVIDGALEHKDSLGNGSVIRPGDVQRMSAGTGVTHSEFNRSPSDELHFLQIWIMPGERGLPPGYEQKSFSSANGGITLVASPDGRDGSVTVHQDVRIYRGKLAANAQHRRTLATDRHVWLQLVSGDLEVNGRRLKAGDGAAISGEGELDLSADSDAHFLLFDLA